MRAGQLEIRRSRFRPRSGARAFRVCFAIAAILIAVCATVLSKESVAWQTLVIYWVLTLCVIGLVACIASVIERCEREARRIAFPAARRSEAEPRHSTLHVALRIAHLEQMIVRQHRFVSDAAHELRTPLTAQSVVGQNVLAKQEVPNEELREAIVSMLEESKHMERLIEGLLDLTRASLTIAPERGTACRSAALDLSALARDCVESLRVLAEEKQQCIEVNAVCEVWADVDLTMVRQALLNVIHNSIEHCPEGTHIQIETGRASATEAFIRVQDDGPGIPLEAQDRLFERFYRGAGTSRKRSLGLGLSIAKAILCSQGGGIELRSSAGAGCCFLLSLPLTPGASPSAAKSMDIDPGRRSSQPRRGWRDGLLWRLARRYQWV